MTPVREGSLASLVVSAHSFLVSPTQALMKVAWDFLLCPVQEDAAVKIKIDRKIAFNGSSGGGKIW